MSGSSRGGMLSAENLELGGARRDRVEDRTGEEVGVDGPAYRASNLLGSGLSGLDRSGLDLLALVESVSRRVIRSVPSRSVLNRPVPGSVSRGSLLDTSLAGRFNSTLSAFNRSVLNRLAPVVALRSDRSPFHGGLVRATGVSRSEVNGCVYGLLQGLGGVLASSARKASIHGFLRSHGLRHDGQVD